jgi:hypothetical protein
MLARYDRKFHWPCLPRRALALASAFLLALRLLEFHNVHVLRLRRHPPDAEALIELFPRARGVCAFAPRRLLVRGVSKENILHHKDLRNMGLVRLRFACGKLSGRRWQWMRIAHWKPIYSGRSWLSRFCVSDGRHFAMTVVQSMSGRFLILQTCGSQRQTCALHPQVQSPHSEPESKRLPRLEP